MNFSAHKFAVAALAGGALFLVWLIWRHFASFQAAGQSRQQQLDAILGQN